ncbi:hypothetical protein BBJ28_00024963 [Nothophytophthora sp. Chile5]|nr:hypothetical protein BBJ28_00024963 [Nothophytophthora sp. Chile5]
MTLTFDIVGLIGSFMISASLVPQIIKVYRTKSAKDLSRSFQLLYVAGLIMLVVYGVAEALWPIYIPVLIELAGGCTLLVMKFIYDSRETKQDSEKDQVDLEIGLAETSSAIASPVPVKYKLVLTPK